MSEAPLDDARPRQKRGFAAMDPERAREISRLGGRAAHVAGTAHEFTKEEAREAGKKGGRVTSQNREYMRTIGARGGETNAKKFEDRGV